MSIMHFTDVLLEDDSSVLLNDKNHENFKQKINLTLSSISQFINYKYYEKKHSQIKSYKLCSFTSNN